VLPLKAGGVQGSVTAELTPEEARWGVQWSRAAELDGTTGRWGYTTQAAVAAGEVVMIQVSAPDRAEILIIKTLHHALT
jgi:hypothetical protein